VRRDDLEGHREPPLLESGPPGLGASNALRIGERLIQRSGVEAEVESRRTLTGRWRVFNLEVERAHCYFAGEWAVLAHNADGQCLGAGAAYHPDEVAARRAQWEEHYGQESGTRGPPPRHDPPVKGYRAVSEKELADVEQYGFRGITDIENRVDTMKDKWFANTADGARTHRGNYPDNTIIIEAEIPGSVYRRSHIDPRIDGFGGFCVWESDLSHVSLVGIVPD
jgi:hypothetical protein